MWRSLVKPYQMVMLNCRDKLATSSMSYTSYNKHQLSFKESSNGHNNNGHNNNRHNNHRHNNNRHNVHSTGGTEEKDRAIVNGIDFPKKHLDGRDFEVHSKDSRRIDKLSTRMMNWRRIMFEKRPIYADSIFKYKPFRSDQPFGSDQNRPVDMSGDFLQKLFASKMNKLTPEPDSDSLFTDLCNFVNRHAVVKNKVPLALEIDEKHMDTMGDYIFHVTKNIHKFSVDQILCVSDVLLVMNHKQLIEYFISHFVMYLTDKWHELHPNITQTVRILFLIGIIRNAPSVLLDNLEKCVADNHLSLSLEEMSLVCISFFVANRSLTNTALLDGIWQVLFRDFHKPTTTIFVHVVSSILKAANHADYTPPQYMMQLGDLLSKHPDIENCKNLPVVSSISHSYRGARVRHEELFSTLANCFNNSKLSRFKDLLRFISSCSMLQIRPPEALLAQCLVMLGDDREMQIMAEFPESVMEGLVGLAILQRYPLSTINHMHSPQILMQIEKRVLDQKMHHTLIDSAVMLECPEYNGYRVSDCPSVNKQWIRDEKNLIDNMRGTRLFRMDGLNKMWQALASETCSGSVGLHGVALHKVLPFTKMPYFEIHLDDEGAMLPWRSSSDAVRADAELIKRVDRNAEQTKLPRVESVLGQLIGEVHPELNVEETLSSFSIKNAMFYDLPVEYYPPVVKDQFPEKRVVLILTSFKQYLMNAPILFGIHAVEIRLLRKAGYYVVIVPPAMGNLMNTMSSSEVGEYVEREVLRPFKSAVVNVDELTKPESDVAWGFQTSSSEFTPSHITLNVTPRTVPGQLGFIHPDIPSRYTQSQEREKKSETFSDFISATKPKQQKRGRNKWMG